MPGGEPIVHPYIPNSVPQVQQEMLRAIGAATIDELYADIPEELRLNRLLNLPEPLLSEAELVRHIEGLLERNQSTRESLSFLGAGCYQHQVPAVCDEINSRGEFLTAYAGEPYEDHGRFQALFEYQSMMGELLCMDVVNVPNYDGFQAAATALRMAARITGRSSVLVPASLEPDKLSMVRGYLQPDISVRPIPFDPATGEMDQSALGIGLSPETAAVYFENPSYLGTLETGAERISAAAHAAGALCVVGVNPISLGVLRPPVDYGADLVCGDIQSLGIHMHFGGGHGGFIAGPDDPRVVMEFPSRLFGIAPTAVEGEYGFGDVAYERTSFARREEGKEWVGTAAALWGITAGVYLALMGPQGMRQVGEGLMQRCRYLMRRLAALPGLSVPFLGTPHFTEFVLTLDRPGQAAAQVNRALLDRGIFGGKDLSVEFPSLGQSLLVCVSELHTRADLDRLVSALAEVAK
jgi:glycine dehydrogenase subunit 1